MNIPAFIAIPLRAVFLVGFLIYVAVGTVGIVLWSGVDWFYRAVMEE